MSSSIVRFGLIGASILLLGLSGGVMYWIARDENQRLAERERQAIEAARDSYTAEHEKETVGDRAGTGNEDLEPLFHDIDTLLSGLSGDDLPDED